MDNQESKPPRRIRYKGKYPRSYNEKYKELQPERYASDVEKVIQKGRTPAGMHLPICVNEIMEFLQLAPGQTGLDATLGYGGHTAEMLKRLLPGGRLYATDVDPFELSKTRERLALLGYGPEVVDIREMNFSAVDLLCEETGPFDFVLADLGVSSMQIDNPERGFSLKTDGPLDLRLNPQRGKPASSVLRKLSQPQLASLLLENADEPFADILAEAIISSLKKGNVIETTFQLKEIIKQTLDFLPKAERNEAVKKSCQRCFQALRIEVNDEFGALDNFLFKLPSVLTAGGRVAIISFHSGEDRRVKKSFQYFFREGIYSEIAPGPIRPGAEEIFNNMRARSAKVRWAVKA